MIIIRKAQSGTKQMYQSAAQASRVLTSRLRVYPDFLIIGGQRCGTTSLFYHLKEYPQIFPSFRKEVHYFDDRFSRGVHWYRSQFPTVIQKRITRDIKQQTFLTGEASPYYIFHPHAPRRVKALLPHVKLIALLRNPIDRAYSQHWLETNVRKETLSFRDAVFAEQERTAGEKEKMLQDEIYQSRSYCHYTYLARGIYVDQLQYWMRFFPREQFLILRSEDLFTNPSPIITQTLEFLGVPKEEIDAGKEFKQYRLPYDKGHTVKASTPKMDPDLRAYLVDYFRPHNARLRAFLGRDFDWDK